jgi:hypothetical protein
MKKLLIAAFCLALVSGVASVQAAPQGQHVIKANEVTDISARKKKVTKGMKSGMKPDASGEGGSGPGSDQGGTKAGGMQKKGM